MNLRRIFLRHSLNFQKQTIKLKNLEIKDFYKFSLVIAKKLADIVHLKNLVLLCLVFSVVVLLLFMSSFKELERYYHKDSPRPGGIYSEGTLGKFYRLNPIYSTTNPTDEDAVNLIFSGLLKRGESRSLKEDMAEKWSLSEDKKTYTFSLKKNIKWHDGVNFTTDDIIFTVDLIQNPDARSPLFETWKGVKAEKVSPEEVKFMLKEPNDAFIENLTVGILPKHILEKIPAASVQTVDFNINPVGTGQYAFETLEKESSRQTLNLKENDKYYGKKPFIEKVIFKSYPDEKELVDAYNKKNIVGVGNLSRSVLEKLEKNKGTLLYEDQLPRYVAMFFNTENEFLKDKNLRVAISLLPDRKEILKNAVDGKGLVVYSPITAGLGGYGGKVVKVEKDQAKANETLKAGNYVLEGNTLKYQGKEVKIRIVTGDTYELKKTAENIAGELNKLGIKTEIVSANMNVLQKEYIRPRNYDVLVLGENLGAYPDLFSFWHSSQINDPGMNFSKYKSRKLDKLLELARKSSDMKEKQPRLDEVQKTIVEEAAAVYLYNPYYFFITTESIKGIRDGKIVSPTDRLYDISDWYINADRVMIDK